MSSNEDEYIPTRLSFPSHIVIGEEDKQYYMKKHDSLPEMKKNQFQVSGIELVVQNGEILVPSFIRSTVSKPVSLKNTTILLVDQDTTTIAKTEVDFSALDVVQPNTATFWNILFPKESVEISDLSEMKSWSLAFEVNTKHQLDLSELKEGAISEAARAQLEEIINESELSDNELSLMGLSAKRDDLEGLEITLLIQNGTKDNLEIKKLPLNFYDAAGELAAQGTFQLKDFTVQTNTSKPMTIVFPKSGILKDNMNLETWSLEHAK